MKTLRRKKLKKNINKISYIAIFTVAATVITVASASGKGKKEYKDFGEQETYVVDVVSRARENLAVAQNSENTTTVATTTAASETKKEQQTTKNDNSSYKGLFMMNATGDLNIRSKAGTESEIVGILTEGNGGTVLQYGDQWTKVKSGKVTGYVATEFILIGDKAKKAQSENGYTATVNADTLMVRSGKSKDSSIIGMAAKGSKYKCSKVFDKWVKIKFEGETGYVSREFVKLDNIVTYAKSVAQIEKEQIREYKKALAKAKAAQEKAEQEAAQAQQQAANDVADNSRNSYTANNSGNSSQSSASSAGSSVSSSSGSQNTSNSGAKVNASYDDSYLLACLVACEAGGESYDAKLAVASVVVNRVASSIFPNSIRGVIYQSGQFGPVSNASLDAMLKSGPDANSKKAANAALGGSTNVPGYLFFGQTGTINTKNLNSYKVIGGQVFY